MGMDDKLMLFHGKVQTVLKLQDQLEKKPQKFGTDDLLSFSEIHLIEVIGKIEGLSVTDIGKRMGVTKGAISQQLKKLETRGYSMKTIDPENQSRTIVHLTDLGRVAFAAHEKWHREMDGGFRHYIEHLGEEELEIITIFLESVERFLRKRIE